MSRKASPRRRCAMIAFLTIGPDAAPRGPCRHTVMPPENTGLLVHLPPKFVPPGRPAAPGPARLGRCEGWASAARLLIWATRNNVDCAAGQR